MSGDELREIFAGLGLEDVAPFRTSGNVVFNAGRAARGELTTRIERGLAEALGWEVSVFLRTGEEVEAIAAEQPFDAASPTTSKGKLQVVLLGGEPSARERDDALGLATDEDLLACGVRELYWLPQGGTRDSGLDFGAVERLLGPTTVRTMGTVERLAAKYLG